MNIPLSQRTLPGIALIIGLMAMALSCGDSGSAATAAAPEALRQSAASDGGQRELRASPSAQMAAATAVPQAAAAPPQAPAAPAQPEFLEYSNESAAVEKEGADASFAEQSQQSGRQLIVEAWTSLEVGEIDANVRQVEALAVQRDGWVESAEVFGEAGYRSASLRVRVPADQLDNMMDALRGLGRVTEEGTSATDVTERLIDNEARLTAWYAQEGRLVTLLENAPTVEDIIEIERRLSEVRSDIERVEATQRNLTNRVATSLITVNLHLPSRFASEPPSGVLTLNVGDPVAIADAMASVVELMGGYVGQKREYDEGRGRVVDMVVFVKPSDLSVLMDHAATLGDASGRNLTSVGPAAEGDVANARLTLGIRSDVDLGGSLSLSASDPLAVGGQIRDQAESLGGFVETWHETQGDDYQSVNMELVVKSADLRNIMDFGAELGETEHWEYNASGQNPVDDAPNARLNVSVFTEDTDVETWAVVGAIIAVGMAAAIVAAMLIRRLRAAARTTGTLEETADGE